jgi:large subunit ribosomal protein L35
MKLRTRKSALKRVKIKKRVLLRKKAYKSHLLSHKNSKRLRNLNVASKVNKADLSTFYKMLPYA